MELQFSTEFLKRLKKIKKQNKGLFLKVEDKVNLFNTNPNHPSLRLHKLGGGLRDSWSLSVDKSIRIIFYYSGDLIVLVDIGTHDQVYKK